MSAIDPCRRLGQGVCLAWLVWSCVGCAHFWDDVTNKEVKFTELWTTPDPVTVLRTSTDNSKRARALAALREPGLESSSKAEQDACMTVLQRSALQDNDPLCRLAAIRTLGRFKDPRAVTILDAAFDAKQNNIEAERNSVIRQQILASLEQTGSPQALNRFILVAKQPAGVREAPSESNAIRDERMTALRALSKFSDPRAQETLIQLLETERDASLKLRAHESLVKLTEQDIPPEGKLWREYATTGKVPAFERPSAFAKFRDRNFTISGDNGATSNEPGVLAQLATKLGLASEKKAEPQIQQTGAKSENVGPALKGQDLPPPQFPNVPPPTPPAPTIIPASQTAPTPVGTFRPITESHK